jgi:hypothetical protein
MTESQFLPAEDKAEQQRKPCPDKPKEAICSLLYNSPIPDHIRY